MCTNPITIRNPYFDNIPANAGYRRFCPTTPTIQVPCGKCADCQQSKTSSMIQRCVIEAQTSHVFNITLTYNDEYLPIAKYQSLKTGEIVKAPYFNVTHLQNMFKRLRKLEFPQNRCFRYFAVSEYGGTYHRPHAHVLLFVSRINGETASDLDELQRFLYDNILSNWSINVGGRFDPVYEPLCTPRTIVKNGKVYSNYQCKLVTPLEDAPDGSRRPISDYQKYLDSLSDPTFVVQYLCKYIYKSDRFSLKINDFLKRNTFFSNDEELLPFDALSRYYRTVSTVRLCSKGLGFGFDPETGKKVYIIGRNTNLKPTLSRLLSDDTLRGIADYMKLPDTVSQIIHLNFRLIDYVSDTSNPLKPSVFINSLSDSEYHIFDLAILCNSTFRRRFHTFFPNYRMPRRVKLPSLSLFKNSSYTLYSTLDNAPSTASVQSIRRVLLNSDNSSYNYPVFSLHGFKTASLSGYYRTFLTLDFWEKFYDSRNIDDYDSLSQTLSNQSSITRSALVEECFHADSVNRHKQHPFVKPLPYDTDFFASSDIFVFSKSEQNRFSSAVHRYNLSYY